MTQQQGSCPRLKLMLKSMLMATLRTASMREAAVMKHVAVLLAALARAVPAAARSAAVLPGEGSVEVRVARTRGSACIVEPRSSRAGPGVTTLRKKRRTPAPRRRGSLHPSTRYSRPCRPLSAISLSLVKISEPNEKNS